MSSNRGQSPKSSIGKQAGDGQVEKPTQISIQQEASDGHASLTDRIFNQQEESDGSLQEYYQKRCFLIMKTVILSCLLSSSYATYLPECTIFPTTECWEVEKPHVEYTTLSEEQCHPVTKEMCKQVHYTVKSREVTSQEPIDELEGQCHTKYDVKCTSVHKMDCPDLPEVVQHQVPHKAGWDKPEKTRHEIPRKICGDVPREECNTMTRQACKDVPGQECHDVPSEVCQDVDGEECREVSREQCHQVPREMVTIVTENVCTKINVEVCRPVPHEKYKDVQDEVTREYVDKEHCEDITTTSDGPVTKPTCNDVVEKVPRREVCVDKPKEECGDKQKPVAAHRIYYQNEKDNRIDAVRPDEVMKMHEKAEPDKEGREPSAKVTEMKHEPPVTASPLPSPGQSQGDNRVNLNVSKSWVFYVVRDTHCSHNNGDDVTREGSTACTAATQHGVTDNNLHLQLPDQSTDDHAQLLHHHPEMVRKNHLSDKFTPVKVENKLMGSFFTSTYLLSQDLQEVHIVFKDDDSSKMAVRGCWPTNTAPRGGNTATQPEANSNLQHQAQLLTDLQHHHHQECWQTNTAPGAGVSTEMLKDRNEIEGTDSKHRPNAETVGGGNTAPQHESTDSNQQEGDLSADDQAQLLRGLRHHHHHHSEVVSVDLLPDTRLEVTPVNIGNKFLGCCFSSTCLLNLKTEMTADRVHQLRKHSPNQEDDLERLVTTQPIPISLQEVTAGVKVDARYHKHIIGKGGSTINKTKSETDLTINIPDTDSGVTVIRIEGSKAGVDKASRELHGMVDRMKNGFHRQLVGPNGENIEKIGKDFATVQSSFPDPGVKSDIVKLEGPKKDVDDCSKDFNTIAKDGNGLDSQASFSEPLVMAAAIPREYNFAPEITELHGTNESKELARQQILDSMDLKEIAVVTNDEWLRFSLEHIAAKSATVDPHPILEHDNLEQFKEFLLTPVQSEAAKMPWALQGLFTEHHTVGNFPSMWDKIQASSISLKILSMISYCEEGLINWAEVFSMIVIATSCNTTDNIVALSVATLARSSCSLSSPMSWVTKSGVFCSRCQDSDCHLDPYSQASLHTVALKLETTVFTHLFTMNMATYSSAKFSTVLGILLGQFENYTPAGTTSTPNNPAWQAWLCMGVCNLMSVESISALSSGSLSSAMSWETKSGMFSLKCQEFDLNQDPYSLTSLPTGALQIETFVCAPLSAMYMATYNSARFSAAQGVLHRQFGSFTLQASSQSLKNLSLHKSFEEWFDTTRMVVSINLINGTTGPIVLTYTGLEIIFCASINTVEGVLH